MSLRQKKLFRDELSNIQEENNHFNFLLRYYRFTKKENKDYPVVSRMLKKITIQTRKIAVEEIKKLKLPKELQRYLYQYKKVGGKRDEFAWKILFDLRRNSNYFHINKDFKEILQKIQFLITTFIVLVDDVADQKRNNLLLNELLKIPSAKNCIKYNKLKYKEKLYIYFSIAVWEEINLLIKKFPRYKELKEVFEYDINQILNSMRYDLVINKNYYLINATEYWLYSPHSMQFVMTPIADLMCQKSFKISELSTLREIFWKAQEMAKIGNWISTWKRELVNKDFSSGVFAYAISQKIITVKDLNKNNKTAVARIRKSNIEKKLLKKWEDNYWKIFNFKEKIESINISAFLLFLENLLIAEIISEKYK